MNHTFFEIIDYDIHLGMKLDCTIGGIFWKFDYQSLKHYIIYADTSITLTSFNST